ncbi:C2H2-type domain-containing protein [Psidium guajava]|nr:C2H2-type domain-containing protein [Psidium guajava]
MTTGASGFRGHRSGTTQIAQLLPWTARLRLVDTGGCLGGELDVGLVGREGRASSLDVRLGD